MPIYEYTCECGKVFDTIQKISEPPLTHCRCDKAGAVTKNLTAAGFALKGSGWYVTDFRGGAAAKPGETKADAKPDAKPDAASAPATTAAAPAPAPAAAATPAAGSST
jgi:putative FmdB family regulatory protein